MGPIKPASRVHVVLYFFSSIRRHTMFLPVPWARRCVLETVAIEGGLDKLGERERRIIELRFFHGRTQMEVASEIGISQAQVSRLEKGALDHIRKQI